MKRLAVGILAHVDAGKTTLSEAMLYAGGMIRHLGRVDKGDAFLDTYELEKKRGITIFSKQARLAWDDMDVTLLDTPGHVDFSAEMERVLQVLDYAVLVISGSDGVQGHTRTLWRLLARYQIPAFLFINKMDLASGREQEVLRELKESLGGNFVDFGADGTESFYEEAAVSGEAELEEFLETGQVSKDAIRSRIASRDLFPCYFGSALKNTGVEEFMRGLEEYTLEPVYPDEFGAKIFKIVRDSQGERLTYMKITGGVLHVKDRIGEEKVNQLRLYSGDKYEAVSEAPAGMICAATGLLHTKPGEGLGVCEMGAEPVLEPVLTYRVELPEDVDAAAMLPKLLQLEEEEPELHIVWEEEKKEIHAQIMGEIQMEILKSLIAERFGVNVRFGGRSIVYKETITDTVEGVGHFEPLRHYAEVHLLLEPGEPGSGLVFDTDCSEDILSKNWQRLVLTHLEEKVHRGVLIGAPITDMKITLKSGRAHVKHTEGGDFRQSVYRAVRQGLMQAHSVLLEPFYAFHLTIPDKMVGRAMTDLERRFAVFEGPALEDGQAILTGRAPVSALDGYQTEVTAYTGGLGQMICTLDGYGPCHNEEEIIAAAGYDPDADLANPSGSVFCAHGAGFVVPWDQVPDYMHLEERKIADTQSVDGEQASDDKKRSESGQADGSWISSAEYKKRQADYWRGEKELEEIFARTYGEVKRRLPSEQEYRRVHVTASEPVYRPAKPKKTEKEYLLVDGYNIIFAWEELKELSKINIDSARDRLKDILCNYQGYRKCTLILVFDAYRVKGHREEITKYHNIHVVYTKEAETADMFIEKTVHAIGRKYQVTVATSDGLEQVIIMGQGGKRLSAAGLKEEVDMAAAQMKEHLEAAKPKTKTYLGEYFPEDSGKVE